MTSWGWNSAVVTKVEIPTLTVDLACSSHNALWERNQLLLFSASLEWLTKGTVNGQEQRTIRLGYQTRD